MNYPFARRMDQIEKSFLDEILRFDNTGDMISFAGGLPNADYFPVEAMARVAEAVLAETPRAALQYSLTEGHPPLRDFIAERYRNRFGMTVSAEDIIITTGSQQAQDLIAKLFLDPGDCVIVEAPAYLGATETMRFYEPHYIPVPITDTGIDTAELTNAVAEHRPTLMYAVPNFQNPTGRTYDLATREEVARVATDTGMMLLEDDPFGELRFRGDHLPPIRTFAPDRTILLGSFSKIVTPGLRIGWVCAPKPVTAQLLVAKQAADLHTSTLDQMILHRFLADNSLDDHIATVATHYGANQTAMAVSMAFEFPAGITFTRPEGGMFCWITLPEEVSGMDLYRLALDNGVAFIPGEAFFVAGGGENTFRLNFSNTDEKKIAKGMKRLGMVVREMV